MINQTDVAGASMHPIVRQPMPFVPYYQDEAVTIYNADCRQVLPFLPKFDLLLTDPPYGIGVDRAMSKQGGTKYGKAAAAKRHYVGTGWDDSTPPSWFLESAKESALNAIVWGGNYYGLPASSCWLVWDKDNTGDFADCELAWTNMTRAVRKFKWRWNGMIQEQMGDKKECRFHPTQKPTALMRWCLSLVPDAKTVLDPFMGSGTTLVASKLEGRFSVGIELELEHCKTAVKRLAQGTLL